MKRRHKHKWSKPYHGIFNGPCYTCEAGPCGAIKLPGGKIIILRERQAQASEGAKP